MRKKRKVRRLLLEKRLSHFDDGLQRCVYSSGVEGIKMILSRFSIGEHIVVVGDLHGGMYRLLVRIMDTLGLEVTFVPLEDVTGIEEVLTNRTVAIYMNINQLVFGNDLEEVSSLARMHGLKFILDNTSNRPYIQSPHQLGADIILHSGTKYVAGYSDIVAGLVVMEGSNQSI